MTAGETLKFPHDPVLVKLLIAAQQTSDAETIVHDECGFERTYPELLGDILKTRELLRAGLPSSAMNEQCILCEKYKHVAILTKSGYEFVVAFFSIRAIGGVCVPLGSGVLPEEAQYFLSKSNATYMLAGRDSMERANGICTYLHEVGRSETLTSLPISCDAKRLRSTDVGIDDAIQMDPGGPGLVVFSSGTTGRPKGAVLPRRCFSGRQPVDPGTVSLNYRPGHWIGGARSLIGPLLAGKKLYTIRAKLGKARAEVVLEAFRDRRINHVSFTPDVLRQIKYLLLENRSELSEEEKGKYSSYFKGLRTIRCSSGMLESSTKDFWTDLTGLPFENMFAATELGGAATLGKSGQQGTIGTPLPGVKVKLSEGIQGELLIKGPNMFSHYIGDNQLTQDAFDEEGYFKTGDLAILKDGEYTYAGRASNDYVQFAIYRISALVVESSLMDLHYISEACVVAVPNNNVKQLCGAIVRLKRGSTPTEQTSLARIRSDLQISLAPFMLPTLLRILKDEEQLPHTVSGKPIKRQILEDYFGSTDGAQPRVYPPGVERCEWERPAEGMMKPWDWGGLQMAN